MNQPFVCGTRKVVKRGTTFHVVCATCESGGSTPHRTKEQANAAAIRDSGKACRECGAA